jgi:acylphosphatase
MSIKRYRVTITGEVQGVGYRHFATKVASEMGVSGWVMNRSGGSVEVEIQGEDELLQRYIEKLRQGPRISRVDDLAITEIEPRSNGHAGFQVRATE